MKATVKIRARLKVEKSTAKVRDKPEVAKTTTKARAELKQRTPSVTVTFSGEGVKFPD
ncbi:hypothetical protein GCM10008014_40040 [Paenibacillus silvae]|uniref:Uncharacterized protein n=1 Tax=Paenibacillus silvae TaxID=1325358 RepID=A0ABQ1ZGN4_9BACL|nr:hypothetical protein GCM10008014_40040 [Paenibacillus silvae]